jgi:hypothetical protein
MKLSSLVGLPGQAIRIIMHKVCPFILCIFGNLCPHLQQSIQDVSLSSPRDATPRIDEIIDWSLSLVLGRTSSLEAM